MYGFSGGQDPSALRSVCLYEGSSPLRVPSVNATNMVPIAGPSARARGFGSKPAFCERQAHQAQGELGWRELGRFDQEILEIYSWANVRM